MSATGSVKPPAAPRRLYVLDTNVLIHDPGALFRFQEHDVYLPLQVIEELDSAKLGASDAARNVRQVSRTLDELLVASGIATGKAMIDEGIALPSSAEGAAGRLFIQTDASEVRLPAPFSDPKGDNWVLGAALALRGKSDRDVVLVSRDINVRIKSRALGLHAEDYTTDRVLDDVDLLYTGMLQAPLDSLDIADGQTQIKVPLALAADAFPRACLYGEQQGGETSHRLDSIVSELGESHLVANRVADYMQQNSVWGVHARNREQNFALNLLMDPEVDFVTLLGAAGTGKTLLALAAGLAQTLDQKRYREIVVTRATVPVGDDIGFLPGTEEEKMTPWMGALMDNLEVLISSDEGGGWGKAATQDLVHSRIKLRSLNFMRGRTFLNRFLIIDEAQNLTRSQIKTLVTRAGPGTKIACIGNIRQIDATHVTEHTSGLTYAVDRFKTWPHAGHITLQRGERSRLADFAAQML